MIGCLAFGIFSIYLRCPWNINIIFCRLTPYAYRDLCLPFILFIINKLYNINGCEKQCQFNPRFGWATHVTDVAWHLCADLAIAINPTASRVAIFANLHNFIEQRWYPQLYKFSEVSPQISWLVDPNHVW